MYHLSLSIYIYIYTYLYIYIYTHSYIHIIYTCKYTARKGHVRKHGIGGEVRHGATSGVLCEPSFKQACNTSPPQGVSGASDAPVDSPLSRRLSSFGASLANCSASRAVSGRSALQPWTWSVRVDPVRKRDRS